jgi:hypothetical protein
MCGHGLNGGRRMSDHVNLEYLRKQAKTILKQCRAGDRTSVERVRAQLPKLASMDLREIAKEVKLADDLGVPDPARHSAELV